VSNLHTCDSSTCPNYSLSYWRYSGARAQKLTMAYETLRGEPQLNQLLYGSIATPFRVLIALYLCSLYSPPLVLTGDWSMTKDKSLVIYPPVLAPLLSLLRFTCKNSKCSRDARKSISYRTATQDQMLHVSWAQISLVSHFSGARDNANWYPHSCGYCRWLSGWGCQETIAISTPIPTDHKYEGTWTWWSRSSPNSKIR
jgi:hypothetical protein